MDTPLSTYRLQLRKEFGFDDAARVVPYLKSLGITHVYTSPFFTARPGSTHGYDVVDHRTLNPEFGGEAVPELDVTAIVFEGNVKGRNVGCCCCWESNWNWVVGGCCCCCGIN